MADTQAKSVVIRHILLNTISNYIGKFTTLGMWFFLTPFILYHLGEASYGLWVLVGSLVAYGSLLDLGIAGAVTKYVAEYRARGEVEQAQGLIATALGVYSVLGLIIVVLSAIAAPIFPALFTIPPGERVTAIWLVLLSGLGMGFSIPCATTSAVLRGLQRFDLINLISIIGSLLSAGATIAVLLLGGGVIGIVVVGIAVTLIMQIPSIWFIHRIVPELRFGWRGANRQSVRTVASFSAALFLLNLGGHLETKTDEITIGAFLPLSAVAPYNIARKLSTLPQLLTDQFLTLLLPLASELHAENAQVRLRSLYITSTRLTLALFLPVGGILVLLAQPILTVWVGVAYADYAHLVLILTLASLIDTSQWPAGFVLQGMARHQLSAVMAICSGVTNLGLSMVLVQYLGLTGVALGTLIPTSIVCLGVILPYAMHVIGVTRREVITKIFLPALIPVIPMVIVINILQKAFVPLSLLSIIVVASIGLLVYVIGYLSIGASAVERFTCRSFALRTIRFARGYLNLL